MFVPFAASSCFVCKAFIIGCRLIRTLDRTNGFVALQGHRFLEHGEKSEISEQIPKPSTGNRLLCKLELKPYL